MRLDYYIKLGEKVLKEPTNNTTNQLVRYTFVGGIAFLVDIGILILLTEYFKVHYLASAIGGFTLGLITNYILSTLWVFSKRSLQNRTLEFALFVGIGIIGLGLNEAALWSFTSLIGLHYLFSKIISTLIVYLWNFFARKYILFN